jgi:acetyl esterase
MPLPDYETLIDAPTWAFIRETAHHYPQDAVGLDIAGQRAVYNGMCAAFRKPRPPGLRVQDERIGGVPCRRYEAGPSTLTVLYFHGGGFVVGGLDSHDDVCAELCSATGLGVISADYRLAPEHLHPAAYDDVLAVAQATPGPLILAGDSAGGALAASLAHALRRTRDLRGMLLIYPGLGGNPDRGSYLTHADAPMLTRADTIYYRDLRHGGAAPLRDPTAAALTDTDFTGLPPTLIVTAACDPLSDDGRDYCEAILAAGGRAVWVEEPGLVHGYLRARHSVPRAKASFSRMIRALSAMADGAPLEGEPA